MNTYHPQQIPFWWFLNGTWGLPKPPSGGSRYISYYNYSFFQLRGFVYTSSSTSLKHHQHVIWGLLNVNCSVVLHPLLISICHAQVFAPSRDLETDPKWKPPVVSSPSGLPYTRFYQAKGPPKTAKTALRNAGPRLSPVASYVHIEVVAQCPTVVIEAKGRSRSHGSGLNQQMEMDCGEWEQLFVGFLDLFKHVFMWEGLCLLDSFSC